MIVLSIETSTKVCSAALCRDGEPIVVRQNQADGNHAALLPRFVEEILSEAKSANLMPEAIALSEGPGSYTGLRIGTSTAKGLCYGLNIPLLTLPTTLVIAAGMEGDERVAMIDARRNEVYTATYDSNLQALTPIEAKILDPEVKRAWFENEVVPLAYRMGALCERGLARRVEGKEIAYYEPFYLKEFVAAPSHIKGLS